MDNEKDDKIKQFITKDKEIPDKINNTFNSFINKIRNDEVTEFSESVGKNDNNFKNINSIFYVLKKLATVAACLLVVFVASNVYAKTQGYDNIFFMIKDLTTQKEERTEIFQDKDIVISYKYFNVANNIEMQINELQVKDNKAKLYLLVKENSENTDTPLIYKVYNKQNRILYDAKSKKRENKKTYTEVLELSNYNENTDEIKLEIYSKYNILLKTVTINLNNKTIEARTENQKVKKISQIELNKFLKEETENIYTNKQLENRKIVILETYDIDYEQGKYIAKYLFMMPSKNEIEDDKVEETQIYSNAIEFTVENEEYKLIKIDKPEE